MSLFIFKIYSIQCKIHSEIRAHVQTCALPTRTKGMCDSGVNASTKRTAHRSEMAGTTDHAVQSSYRAQAHPRLSGVINTTDSSFSP